MKRAEAALPSIPFRPQYGNPKDVVPHVTDQLKALKSFEHGSIDHTTKPIGARSITSSNVK
jgi:hypothetical protein